MSRKMMVGIALTGALTLLASSTVFTSANGNGGSKKPPTASAKPATKPPTASAPKQTSTKSVKPPKPTAPKSSKAMKPTTTTKSNKPVKTTTTKSSKPAKTTKAAKTEKSAKSATTTTTTETTDKKKSSTTTTTDGETLTAVQQKLQKNTKLAAKLESRLPAGMDLMEAAEGFRNLGQFVAAVNVSNNQGIEFTELKTLMVDEGMSLGQSIKKLRPTANSTQIATQAEQDAATLIRTNGGQ